MQGQVDPGLRKRATAALFAAVAFGTTAFVASITVAPLAGEDLSGSAAWSGVPWALGVLGTGIGSLAISQLMARRGRSPGLLVGYMFGAIGGMAAACSILAGRFELLILGSILMGVGNSANHLARYAAADLYPIDQRGAGLARVVWAGTIGGVIGPGILDASGSVATSAGAGRLVGPFAVGVIGCLLAVVILGALRIASPRALVSKGDDLSRAPLWSMWKTPTVAAALVTLAVAQTVMVLIMAMTPLHIRHTGHDLASVGIVISAHVFGMYGLSPLSGRLSDAVGPTRVIVGGFVVMAVSALGAAASPPSAGRWLVIPLFGLGFGWSLCFVSGSALLTRGLEYTDRARLQGATDLVVWTSAAIAGLGSGLLVSSFGYAVLCVAGAVFVIFPIVTLTRRARAFAFEAP